MGKVGQDSSIDFGVANRAVAHLGRKLYDTTPPALGELVANSFDAYATRVDIVKLDGADGCGDRVVVADDGVGMDIGGLRGRYARIGQMKKDDDAPSGMEPRPPMGKKGIGKLAAFSIGNVYEVYTKTRSEDEWVHFTLDYEKLLACEDATYPVPYETVGDLPPFLTDAAPAVAGRDHGFVVLISGLRRGWTRQTDEGLSKQLARRFSLPRKHYNFCVYNDGEAVDLSNHWYFDSLELVCTFGGIGDDLWDFEGKEGITTANLDPVLEADDGPVGFSQMKEDGLRGWLGFVTNPSQLALRNGGGAGVAIYMNGKIADDDAFRDSPKAEFASRYLVGEVHADFLGQDGLEDSVTSSRQGLDRTLDAVEKLLAALRKARSAAFNEWNRLRSSTGTKGLPSFMAESEEYNRWMEDLPANLKRVNSSLLKAVKVLGDEGSLSSAGLASMVNGTIELVETMKRNDCSTRADELIAAGNSDEALLVLVALMHDVNLAEADGARRIASERVEALDRLEQLIEDEAPEREFQRLFEENPWIINPSWKPNSDKDASFQMAAQEFNRVRSNDGKESRTFIDILISMRDGIEEKLVIVELKRSKRTNHSGVDRLAILSQIDKYRTAIIQNVPAYSRSNRSDIPAVCIVPNEVLLPSATGRPLLDGEEVELLRNENIDVVIYKEMVGDTKRRLTEELGNRKYSSERPFFELYDLESSKEV